MLIFILVINYHFQFKSDRSPFRTMRQPRSEKNINKVILTNAQYFGLVSIQAKVHRKQVASELFL